MSGAKEGDKVKVHYSGASEDGKVFDSSEEKDPLEFTIGQKMVIPGFEKAVIGMTAGETKKVLIQPKDGYGEPMEDLVATVDRSRVPDNIDPQMGMMFEIDLEEGSPINVTVTALNEKTITLDGNHPLAGKELTFELNLVSID